MREYCKINTCFKRDAKNIIIPTQYASPEFEYLKDCKWESTEKIDGTNMSVQIEVTKNLEGNTDYKIDYCGRTNKAQIPSHMLNKMHELFDHINWSEVFPNLIVGDHIELYGEGYGMKIQSGGNYLPNDVSFILFDVRINDWWLQRENIVEIADKLAIATVPLIGYFTLQEAIEYVKKGFISTISDNREYKAEGLVLKTPYGLRFRNGQRIMTKIKTCDFEKFKAVYGDNPSPIQEPNPHY